MAVGGFVVAEDDREGVEDVRGVISGEAVEVEVERVEAGTQVAALLVVPDEWGGRRSRDRGRWCGRTVDRRVKELLVQCIKLTKQDLCQTVQPDRQQTKNQMPKSVSK